MLVFFYDILIYLVDVETHEKYLRVVFEVLRKHQLFLKQSKCVLGAKEVEYLGHLISSDGVQMDKQKVMRVLDWLVPKNLKELRGFLGLTSYYRRFIKGYGEMARPLTDCLKKGVFKWSESASGAFEKLKKTMTVAPVLALLDFEKTFMVETDASGLGVGVVLTQKGRPINYFSKALSPKHQTQFIYEKELLVVLLAVKK